MFVIGWCFKFEVIFQFSVHKHFMLQSLSQGDSAAFQKSVKVLGYQMRIMISLIDTFVDYISECEGHVVKLLMVLQR